MTRLKLITMLSVAISLIACSGNSNSPADTQTNDRVEVIYFHGKQRCVTCMAIEQNVTEVMNEVFSPEIESGRVVFKIVDISTPDGEALADNYEVTWSSLFVNVWSDGKETRDNLTEYSFSNARSHPDEFKKTLSDKIRNALK